MNAPARPPGEVPQDPLGLVMDTALDAVIVMNSAGVICGWSAQAALTFQYSRAEAIGQLLADMIVPERYRDAHAAGIGRFLETGEGPVLGKRLELTALRKDGHEFPIELSISPWSAGAELKFIGFVRDISDRRQIEQSMIREAREATLVGQLTASAAGETSFEGIVRECLAAVCELTGWPLGHAYLPSSGQPIELHPTGIWHPVDHPHADFRRLTEQSVFSPGTGLPGHVWEAAEPVWIRELPEASTYPRTRAARVMGLTSAFGFPLFVHGRIAIIFEFFNSDKSPPDMKTRLLVRTLADQVGRVLERRASEESLRAEIARRQQVEKHQNLLLAEMNHRVKNMLAVVIGMASQTGRSTTSYDGFKESFNSRLHGLARGYQLLTERVWRPALLANIIEEVVGPHVGEITTGLLVDGCELYVPPKQALALSMIFHELTTNAVKYGALSRNGCIHIFWSKEGSSIRLVWQESGMIDLAPGTTRGFGSKFIHASARHELRGTFEVTYRPGGIECHLVFPVDSEWRA